MRLVPCDSCARHVRVESERCPFCDAPVTPRAAPHRPNARLSRAALWAALVTCAASAGGACKKETITSRAGQACKSDGDCASGERCCESNNCASSRFAPAMPAPIPPLPDGAVVYPRVEPPPPCVELKYCYVAHCPDFNAMPYGCVFPDACGSSVV